MAKRRSVNTKKKVSRSHKTAKRLATKRAMLAARKPKRNSALFKRTHR